MTRGCGQPLANSWGEAEASVPARNCLPWAASRGHVDADASWSTAAPSPPGGGDCWSLGLCPQGQGVRGAFLGGRAEPGTEGRGDSQRGSERSFWEPPSACSAARFLGSCSDHWPQSTPGPLPLTHSSWAGQSPQVCWEHRPPVPAAGPEEQDEPRHSRGAMPTENERLLVPSENLRTAPAEICPSTGPPCVGPGPPPADQHNSQAASHGPPRPRHTARGCGTCGLGQGRSPLCSASSG